MSVEQLDLRSTSEGTLLKLKALPGSRNNGLKGVHGDRLKVAVTTAAEKGKANRAIIALLAEELGLRARQIELTAGAASTHKTVLIQGIDDATLRRRIADRLSAS